MDITGCLATHYSPAAAARRYEVNVPCADAVLDMGVGVKAFHFNLQIQRGNFGQLDPPLDTIVWLHNINDGCVSVQMFAEQWVLDSENASGIEIHCVSKFVEKCVLCGCVGV